MLSQQFLAVLACPKCDSRPPLEQTEGFLVCTVCRYRYPVVDGIPHLVAEDALPPEGKSEPTSGHESQP